ncbi:MAG: hypothetical protein IPN85_14160 [Flavobacteriales bacterium]|nr:hypothetical protein [Flavobacteriales bacterium]
MHSVILFPIVTLVLMSLSGEPSIPRSPCPCDAKVVVVSDTALAHHPDFEGIADTSATYRLGFLNATGIGNNEVRRLIKKMDLATGQFVKCDQAFLRSLCQNSPNTACLETMEIETVGPLHFMPDGSRNITLHYSTR